MECAGIRESTSRNQANGSTPHRLQEAMKLRNTAALLPAIIAAKNVQLPRPRAISRLARSVRRCQSPTRRIPEGPLALPTDSAHSAPRPRTDSLRLAETVPGERAGAVSTGTATGGVAEEGVLRQPMFFTELLHGYSAALLCSDSFGPLVCFRVGRLLLDESVARDTTMQHRPAFQE